MFPLVAKILHNIVHFGLTELLCIYLHVDGTILIGVELKLVDTAMNGANYLAGSSFIEIHLEVGMERPFRYGEDTISDYSAFGGIDVDELAEDSDVANVLLVVVEGTVEFEDADFVEFDLRDHMLTLTPDLRKNILEE